MYCNREAILITTVLGLPSRKILQDHDKIYTRFLHDSCQLHARILHILMRILHDPYKVLTCSMNLTRFLRDPK